MEIKVKMRSPSKVKSELKSESQKKVNAAHRSYKKEAAIHMKEANKKRDAAYSHMRKHGG